MAFGLIHHIEIYVSNLEKTRDFWSWLLGSLGWQSYQNWESGFSYRNQSSYIVFVQAQEKYLPDGYNRCRIGLNHLAFHVDQTEQLQDWAERLQQRGVPLLYLDKGIGHAIYFEDPDRIKVELSLSPVGG